MAVLYLVLLGDCMKKRKNWVGLVRMRNAYEISAGRLE
jgi:hypothetical protein